VDPVAGTVYVPNEGDSTVSVIDAVTGLVTATIPVGSGSDEVAVDPGTHTAYVTNGSSAGIVSVIGAAVPAPTPTPVTTVTSSQNPATSGQPVTFTAMVSPADGGTITFSSGPATLCRAVPLTYVIGSTYQATCTTTALPAGRDTITATYPGDASYTTSVGTLTQTITGPPAKVSFSAPTDLTAFDVSATGYHISWNAVKGPDGQNPSSYTVATYSSSGVLVDEFDSGSLSTLEYGKGGKGLPKGEYHTNVWANGGTLGPPHATVYATLSS
jgi:YVTN family beta-propeller protein